MGFDVFAEKRVFLFELSMLNDNITNIKDGGDAALGFLILFHLQIWNKPLTEKDSQNVLTAGTCTGIPAAPSNSGLKQAQRRHSTTFNYLKAKSYNVLHNTLQPVVTDEQAYVY